MNLYGPASKPILQMRKKTPKIHKKWDKWDFTGFEFPKPSVYAASRVRTPCPPPKKNADFDTKLALFILPEKAYSMGFSARLYFYKMKFSRHESVSWRFFTKIFILRGYFGFSQFEM